MEKTFNETRYMNIIQKHTDVKNVERRRYRWIR